MVMAEIVPIIWLMMFYGVSEAKNRLRTDSASPMSRPRRIMKIKNWLASVTRVIAECPVVDTVDCRPSSLPEITNSQIRGIRGINPPLTPSKKEGKEEKKTMKVAEVLEASKVGETEARELREILWALKIRKYYGGMDCDMHMLAMSTRNWFSTSIESAKPGSTASLSERKRPYRKPKEKLKTLSVTTSSTAVGWDWTAADHHCTDILTMLQMHVPTTEVSEEMWKKVLWVCGGSVTNKRNIGVQHTDSRCLQGAPGAQREELFRIHSQYSELITSLQRIIFTSHRR